MLLYNNELFSHYFKFLKRKALCIFCYFLYEGAGKLFYIFLLFHPWGSFELCSCINLIHPWRWSLLSWCSRIDRNNPTMPFFSFLNGKPALKNTRRIGFERYFKRAITYLKTWDTKVSVFLFQTKVKIKKLQKVFVTNE